MKCQFEKALKPWKQKRTIAKNMFSSYEQQQKCRLKSCKWVLTAKKFDKKKQSILYTQFVNGSFPLWVERKFDDFCTYTHLKLNENEMA